MVLSALGFGTISILVTFATRAGAPMLSVLMWRYVIAAALLWAAAYAAGVRRPSSRAIRIILLAGLLQAVIAGMSMSALRYIPAGTLGFLFYTYPAWVALIARVLHSEPLTPLRLFALTLSLGGIFVMVGAGEGMSLHPAGVALALASAVLYAAYVPMIGRMQSGLAAAETSAYVSVGAAFFLGVGALALGELALRMHPAAWLSIAGLAVFSTAFAFLMFLRGLAVLGPVRTAIVSTVEPFFTSLVGALLLAQPFTRRAVLGGTLIAIAVVLLQLRPANGAARSD